MLDPLLFVPPIFALVGGAVFYMGWRTRQLARASRSWPSTTGKMLKSSLQESRRRDKDGKTQTSYHAAVSYEFDVQGETIQGDVIYFGLSSSSFRSGLTQLVNKYPVGASVTVYYDPLDPRRCTLEQRAAGSSLFVCFIGGLFLTIGLVATGAVLWNLATSPNPTIWVKPAHLNPDVLKALEESQRGDQPAADAPPAVPEAAPPALPDSPAPVTPPGDSPNGSF